MKEFHEEPIKPAWMDGMMWKKAKKSLALVYIIFLEVFFVFFLLTFLLVSLLTILILGLLSPFFGPGCVSDVVSKGENVCKW